MSAKGLSVDEAEGPAGAAAIGIAADPWPPGCTDTCKPGWLLGDTWSGDPTGGTGGAAGRADKPAGGGVALRPLG